MIKYFLELFTVPLLIGIAIAIVFWKRDYDAKKVCDDFNKENK